MLEITGELRRTQAPIGQEGPGDYCIMVVVEEAGGIGIAKILNLGLSALQAKSSFDGH